MTVPAKMSTCKNMHLTILRQRFLIRRKMGAVRITSLNPKFNGSHFVVPPSSTHRMTSWVANSRILWRTRTAPISPVKCSRELVAHQPQIWAPNSLHFAHAIHVAHVGPNLCLRFDCRSKGFAHAFSRSGPHACAHKTSVLLNHLLHHNYCLSKEMHMISRVSKTQFMRIFHRRRGCNFQISSKYRYFIRVFPGTLPSIPCLSAHNKNEIKTLSDQLSYLRLKIREVKEKQRNTRARTWSPS